MKATVENPRGSVEKLYPKESVEGAHTVLGGSVRAPEGFSEGKLKAAKPQHSVGTRGTQFFPHCPNDFQQLLLSKECGLTHTHSKV